MPGVRIDIDTSGAVDGTAKLKKGLVDVGVQSVEAEKGTKKLVDSFSTLTTAADKVAASFNKQSTSMDAAMSAALKSATQMHAAMDKMVERLKKAEASAAAMSSKAVGMGAAIDKTKTSMGGAGDGADRLGRSLGSLQSAVGVVAAAFGAWRLAEFAKDAALATARYDTLNVVMKVVGNNAGYTNAQMVSFAQGLQTTGISMNSSRDAMIKMAAAQLDLTQATKLARVAQDAAVIGNVNSSEAYGRMVRGIQSGEVEILRTLGIMVNFDQAYEEYAQTLGTTKEALTDQEKAQARLNTSIEYGKNIAGSYEAAMGTAGKQITSFQRYVEDFEVVFGRVFQDSLNLVLKEASTTLKEMTEAMRDMGSEGGQAVAGLVSVFTNLAGAFKDILGWLFKIGELPVVNAYMAFGGGANYGGLSAMAGAGSPAEAVKIAEEARRKELRDRANAIAMSGRNTGNADSIQSELDEIKKIGEQNAAKALSGAQDRNDKYLQANSQYAPYLNQFKKIYADRDAVVRQATQDLATGKRAGDTTLVEKATLALAIADRKAAEEHEKLNKSFDKTKGSGDTARKSFYEVSEAMNNALGASETWTGDKWSGKFRALLADLDKDLKSAKTPVEEYWAHWEYGAKKATAQFEQWVDTIKRSGELTSQIGALSFDPGKQFAGDKDKLSAEWLDAVKAAGDSQEEIARVNELYQLKEVELREKSLGDMAQLDDGYWERRKTGLDAQFEHLKAQGVNEHALAVHMAQERDKLNKEQLEKRLGYEDSFSGYLADRLALQYGLYKDAETQKLELWAKTADAAIELFDGITESFTWAMGQGFGDLLTGKFKDIENYTQQLLAQLKNVFANWLTEMARIAANKYIVYPIMGQIVGTAGSFSAGSTGVPGLNTQGGDGASITDVTTYLGYGKDAYSMFSGGGAGAASLASEAAQGANFVGPSVQLANAGVPGSSSLTTLGALGAGAAAGGIGYMAGGFVRPDNPTASYVGAGAGLAAGTIAGMAGLGALAATGVGALVAIPAALAVGLAQPNTVKSEWSVPNASKSAIMIAGGENTNAAYGVIKQTSSGAFGSSSTSHKSIFGIASPEMAAQQDAAWEAATAGLDGFTKAVGVSSDQLTNAKSSFNFPAIPIPDGMDAEVYRNVANAEAEHTLAQLGMLDAIKAVTKDGEAYIDTLNRLYSTMTSMDAITQATGFDFSRLTAGMDELNAADYVSKFADAAGGIQEVQTALGLLTAHTMDNASRTSAAIANMTGQADSHLVALGVSFEDFWGQMEAAFSGPLDPAIAATWKDAAKLVDQLDTLKKSMDAINSAARQFDASLSARALSAQGFTYQASLVSMLAAQEAELTQARIDGATAAQLSRLAEVQAMEQAALARQRAEQGDSIRSGLASRIATATGDSTYWMTEAVANKQKDYFKLVWDYGYELADMSNRAYDTEIQARLASEAEAARLSREAFALDIRTRKLTLAGKADEAGALKLIADQAEQYRNAIASGLGAGDLDALLQVQRDELTDYWNKLVDDLKSAAAAIRDTVADLRAGDKSPLPVDQRYAMARAQFDAVVAKGMTGDRLAMSDAQSLAPSVLDALMATTTDRDVYAGGFGEVTSALSKLADVLVGVQQSEAAAQQQATYTQNLSRAESAYNQAKTQATEAFRASMEGQIAQGLAYTGAGAGAVTDLAQSGYAYTGGLTVDAYLRANPGKITDYIGWFQQNYGMTGSGQFDAWSTLEKLMGRGITPDGTSDLYSAALAALENLKAVRGYATGGFVTTPQLAMVAENEPELIIPLSKLRPGASSGGGGNGDLVAAIRELKAENAELRREQRQLLLKIESNTYELSQRMGVRADKDGFPVRVVS